MGWEFNPETQRRERFLIAQPEDLDRECLQAKERRLLEIVQAELRTGRRCHIYAVYTQKRDVTRRLESILAREGIRVAVLTSDVPTEKREAWFETKLQQGIQVTICHPKIIETGLDLLSQGWALPLHQMQTNLAATTVRLPQQSQKTPSIR